MDALTLSLHPDTTGTKAVGDGLQYVTGGVENGANAVGKGAEDAGQWKKP